MVMRGESAADFSTAVEVDHYQLTNFLPNPKPASSKSLQHAWVGSFDRALAVARVALRSECSGRSTVAGVFK